MFPSKPYFGRRHRPISGRNIAEAKVPRLYIRELCQRLTELARDRVQSGEVSERRLAKLSTISQPHLHNVLKGIRILSPEAADRLMRAMDITIPQILWSGGGVDATGIGAVPLLRARIGPGSTASFDVFRGYMPLPVGLTSSLTDPVMAYLAADLALPAEYRAGDLALLDTNSALRREPAARSGFIVAENAGLRVRYVRRVRSGLEVASQPEFAGDWQTISLQGRDILDIVRARIVWIGREMETPLAGPSATPRQVD